MRIFATGFSDGFDGPGRRWVVYIKGCNLRCRWCANPESLSFAKQVLYYPARERAGEKVCPYGAISPGGRLNRSRCERCEDFACVTRWKHKAFELAGRDVTPQWILEEALRAKPLFDKNGGVTFGGGEPTLQTKELLDAIGLLKDSNIHTAMETNAGTSDFIQPAGKVDWLICDLKCVSGDTHEKWTGSDNELILKNIRAAGAMRKQLMVRIPLVVGFNDAPDEAKRMAEYLSSLDCPGLLVEVLRMHHIGRCKYKALDMEYPAEDVPEPTSQAGESFVNALSEAGLNVRLA